MFRARDKTQAKAHTQDGNNGMAARQQTKPQEPSETTTTKKGEAGLLVTRSTVRVQRPGWVIRTSHHKNLRLASGEATYVMNAN